LKVGDTVVSYDETTNTFVTSTIGAVIIHSQTHNPADFKTYPLLKVSIMDVQGNTKETLVTSNHPYFDSISHTYKDIGTFAIGDHVLLQDGQGTIVASEVVIDGTPLYETQTVDVYNLHMNQGPANYLVNGVVVHNKSVQ
jgi:hypothetical protein